VFLDTIWDEAERQGITNGVTKAGILIPKCFKILANVILERVPEKEKHLFDSTFYWKIRGSGGSKPSQVLFFFFWIPFGTKLDAKGSPTGSPEWSQEVGNRNPEITSPWELVLGEAFPKKPRKLEPQIV